MSFSFSRTGLACAFAALTTLSSFDASAQSLTSSDFSYSLQYYGQNGWIDMNATEQASFFNRARCECVGDTTSYRGYFRIALQPGPLTGDKIKALLSQNAGGSGVLRLYAGSNVVSCLNPASAVAGAYVNYCLNLIDPGYVSAGIEGGVAVFEQLRVWYSPPIPVAWLFNVVGNTVCFGSACNATEGCGTLPAEPSTVTIYLWAQTGTTPTPDMQDSSFTVTLADEPSLKPVNVTAVGGNDSVTVSWGWQDGLDPAMSATFLGVQILCARGQSDQVFKTGTFAASYMTSAGLCPKAAPVPSAPQAFGNLDPVYLCSDLLPPSATSYRINGLQSGAPYAVGVVAVDNRGNVSPLASTEVVYPVAGPGGTAGSLGGQGGAVVGGQGGTTLGGQGGQGGELDGGPASSVHLAHGCSCTTAGHERRRQVQGGLVLLGLAAIPFLRRRLRR